MIVDLCLFVSFLYGNCFLPSAVSFYFSIADFILYDYVTLHHTKLNQSHSLHSFSLSCITPIIPNPLTPNPFPPFYLLPPVTPGPFEARITQWNATLQSVSELIDEWTQLQRNWLYLQPIFDSADINKQLPLEGKRFATVE